MTNFDKFAELTARVLLAAIFLISGLGKIGHYAGTQGYMESSGVPGALLPLVIVLEVAGALAIMTGWQTRIAALALAAFSLLAAVLFHSHWQEQIQMILFLKNVAITGGFLLLYARGPGEWSLDVRRNVG